MLKHTMKIAGLTRDLPLCRVTDDLYIGAFVIFGDVALTKACATELLKRAPEFDYILTAETKGIPLAYEMCRQADRNDYILARKDAKLYMTNVFKAEVRSITTDHIQTLYLDKIDAEKMHGKRILIVDDVISTGESLHGLEELAKQVGGIIVGKMAILAEGKAQDREDLIYLEKLPIFNAKGEIIG